MYTNVILCRTNLNDDLLFFFKQVIFSVRKYNYRMIYIVGITLVSIKDLHALFVFFFKRNQLLVILIEKCTPQRITDFLNLSCNCVSPRTIVLHKHTNSWPLFYTKNQHITCFCCLVRVVSQTLIQSLSFFLYLIIINRYALRLE